MSKTNKIRSNQEVWRRFYMLFTATILVAVHVLLIYLILHYNYNQDFRTRLYLRGHLFVLGIYGVVFIALGRVFGGLLVGARRNGEVLFSELFTCLFSNFVFYLIIMMYSFKFPTPVPLLGATGLQVIFSALWIFLCGRMYRRLFRPYQVLLIYDGNAAEDFRNKLKTRRDQLQVSDMIRATEPIEEIYKKIDEVNTVIIWDVEVSLRNIIFKHLVIFRKMMNMKGSLSKKKLKNMLSKLELWLVKFQLILILI